MISKTLRFLILVTACLCSVTYLRALEVGDQSSITFLDKKRARVAIVADSLEKYFNQLQPMEMAAKTGSAIGGLTIEEQRNQCRQRYQDAAQDFSDLEKEAIRWYIDLLQPVLIRDYPLFGKMAWSFLKVSDNIEGGLPHTRDRHIVLSASICNQLVKIRQLPVQQMTYLVILELFAHEQFHVFQRMHPQFCDPLYINVWGFEKADSITGCQWLAEHQLANPDAVDCRWILPIMNGTTISYLWPLVVFAEGDGLKKMPGDFNMIAISVDKREKLFTVQVAQNNKPVFQELQLVPAFRTLFPLSSNIYHPNEAAADMLAQIIIIDSFVPRENIPQAKMDEIEQNLSILRKWFTANLKNQSGPSD
jgi:hypothetical protein